MGTGHRFVFIGDPSTNPAAGAALVTTDAVQRAGTYQVRLFVSSSILPLSVEFQQRGDGLTKRTQLYHLSKSPFVDDVGRFHALKNATFRVLNRNAVVGEVTTRITLEP